MRKVVMIAVLVISLLFTVSCKRKVYLEADEYYVYQYGEIVESFHGEGSYEYRFSEIQNERLREGLAETKRGISIGSSVDDVAKAYKGVGFYFSVVGEPYSEDNYYTSYKRITDRYFKHTRVYSQAEFYERSKGTYFPDEKTFIITFITKIYSGEIIDEDSLIGIQEAHWPDSDYSFSEYGYEALNSMILYMIFELDENYTIKDIIIGRAE